MEAGIFRPVPIFRTLVQMLPGLVSSMRSESLIHGGAFSLNSPDL
jgi:hypothetical protein